MAGGRTLTTSVITGLMVVLGLTVACSSSAPAPTAASQPSDTSPAVAATQPTSQPGVSGPAAVAAQPTPRPSDSGPAVAAAQPTPSPTPQPSVGSVQPAVAVATREPGALSTASAGATTTAEDRSTASDQGESEEPRYRMFRSLPKDGILAIFEPKFITADEAGSQMQDKSLVIGLSINGEHHAYSVAFLSSHEVVNDVVGGEPVAVTW